jgi:hypothetical protein
MLFLCGNECTRVRFEKADCAFEANCHSVSVQGPMDKHRFAPFSEICNLCSAKVREQNADIGACEEKEVSSSDALVFVGRCWTSAASRLSGPVRKRPPCTTRTLWLFRRPARRLGRLSARGIWHRMMPGSRRRCYPFRLIMPEEIPSRCLVRLLQKTSTPLVSVFATFVPWDWTQLCHKGVSLARPIIYSLLPASEPFVIIDGWSNFGRTFYMRGKAALMVLGRCLRLYMNNVKLQNFKVIYLNQALYTICFS